MMVCFTPIFSARIAAACACYQVSKKYRQGRSGIVESIEYLDDEFVAQKARMMNEPP